MTLTLSTEQVVLARTMTATDPHAHHRRDALARRRTRRRARRAALVTRLVRTAAAPLPERVRPSFAVASGSGVDL